MDPSNTFPSAMSSGPDGRSGMKNLPKAYEASSVETDIYKKWEDSGAFNPDKLVELDPRYKDAEQYCIVFPPPNRTGNMHMGHAKTVAIEDILIRFHRMLGRKAYWIPGTDHAAISTQVKVEQLLIKQGMNDPRRELGREKFLEKVREFAQGSRDNIVSQCKAMGGSMDWNLEKYTLDEPRNRAVNQMFKMMYEDGLIERGDRIVNWDPKSKTVISDDEIEYVDETAPFYTFKYGPFEIGTSRPETKFGDKYVVMHPDDPRYKDYKDGQKIELEWINGKITATVIKDPVIDMEFGTGVMTITPWHDNVDYELAERHGLDKEQIIDYEGNLLPIAGEFSGLPILEARKKVVEKLKQKGLLVKVDEKYIHRVATAQRGGGLVEPQIMRQWFVRVNKKFKLRQDTLGKWKKGEETTLKDLMRHSVESGQIRMLPENQAKIYFHWVDNLRDWCISRQIWFGHQIPVWYKGEEVKVGSEPPGEGWERDPDTLDTWFSSGMWTFSTLGWPDEEEWKKNRTFHPTNVLETGRDIIFFWVARMILMSTYALGEVPFKDAYLHGLVLDEKGRKMSKSLGNTIEPLEMIPKYGTDAVRLSLVMGTSPGMDQKLSEDKIQDFRNFTNKLWNIGKFILSQIGDADVNEDVGKNEPMTTSRDWFLLRLKEVTQSVTSKIQKYDFSSAGEELRDFTWNDLADWYLEIAKIEKPRPLHWAYILGNLLRLWHPFMPFITEYIWQVAGFKGLCMLQEWPRGASHPMHDGGYRQFEIMRTMIVDVRRLRAEQSIEPVKFIQLAVVADKEIQDLIEKNILVVKRLARLESIDFVGSIAEGWASAVSGAMTIGLDLAGTIDVEAEKVKLQKEIDGLKPYVVSTEAKLQDKEFASKAPEKVVQSMQTKLDEAKAKLKALEERLMTLS